jgi:hypothetical protein
MKNKKSRSGQLISQRIFFKSKSIRNQFFNTLLVKFGTWKEVGKNFNIYKSRLERLRSGEISIPDSLYLKFLTCIGEQDKGIYNRNIILRDEGWGRSKGGRSTYQKRPGLFKKGRVIGSRKTRYSFPQETPLTPELSELIGAFIGDGFTNQYGTVYIVQYTGDAVLDRSYFQRLKSLLLSQFPKSNPIITKNQNTLRLTIYSKEFHKLLTGRFEFPKGKKAHSVKIPNEILESEKTIISSCITGIFDTDGGVYFDRRKMFPEPYLRIELHMESTELLKQIQEILIMQKINSRLVVGAKRIQINGQKSCKEFVRRIGFNNQRHSAKLNQVL